MKVLRIMLAALAWMCGITVAAAQGTLPIALTQQFSFTNCSSFSNACGTPLSGGLLYFYQVGTVATPQDSFQDTGLTLTNPWPLTLDAQGRIPAFYLAAGSVHVRLTDSQGVVQFDVPSILVVGGTANGGGGTGSGIDATTVASTGDVKWRPSTEFLSGWLKLNGTTIGSATSGATQRGNADTQALFVWLWSNCPNTHCPVPGGRGSDGLSDFNANKQMTLPDLRGRAPWGLDDMGSSASGRLAAAAITSGGTDAVTTPNATGGESQHTLSVAEMPQHRHTVVLSDPGHTHGVNDPGHHHEVSGIWVPGGADGVVGPSSVPQTTGAVQTAASATGISIAVSGTGAFVQDGAGNVNATGLTGSSQPHNNMSPFMLGTWYLKQ